MSKRYRALTGLTYPTSTAVVKRILAGEKIALEDRGAKHVSAGEIVDDIPSVSVPWLAEQGLIEEVADG